MDIQPKPEADTTAQSRPLIPTLLFMAFRMMGGRRMFLGKCVPLDA